MISQLLVYSLKAAFTLTLLYAPYMLLLQKEKFFRLNRVVLIGIVVMSLILPMCNVSFMSLDNMLVVKAAHQQMIEIGMPIRVQDATMLDEIVVQQSTSSFSLFQVLAILYFAGLIVTVIIRCAQLSILNYTLNRRNVWTKRTDEGIRICCRRGQFIPYSWLRTIVISEGDWNDKHDEIIMHETGHILSGHSLDMLLLMLCQALQWYNPFAWLIGRSLSDVHEYEADDYVLRQGINIHDYQILLIKKAVGASSYTFANSFNHSLTKKRITMMQKSNQNPWRRSRVLYVIPVAAISLSVFATPKFIEPVSQAIESLDDQLSVSTVSHRQDLSAISADKVTNNPETVQAEELETALNAAESTNEMSTSESTNEKIASETTQKEAENVPEVRKEASKEIVEVIAEFPGGTAELYKFLAMNIRYPKEAQEMGIQGRVIMKLTINELGEITNVQPIKLGDSNGENAKELTELKVNAYKLSKEKDGGEPATEEELEAVRKGNLALITEAERVIKKMPKWTPAKKDGKNVASDFILPISFRLQ